MRISLRKFPFRPLAVCLLAGALLTVFFSSGRLFSALHDFLLLVEPLPEPVERELFITRLSTHELPLNAEETENLSQVLAAGYRRLLIYYSLPDPWREKFVDCSPLAKGMSPKDFFRRKLAPLRIEADRYTLVEIKAPYGEGEPFRTLAAEVARLGSRSVTFSARPLEQRWFALQAARHFGVRAHSFNRMPQRPASERSWWCSHAGLEGVALAYLKLLGAYWP